ncbi:cytochrome P450 [Zychaea mexicana]|uniref:cytochrome P450 n=1 Tax=Zychaea mexicana TaxID=64656 RepID=UPI0022FF3FD3|nr:cytochrome P450 [Zychaea mexicana]KAI9496236.1 cytochrome P450 [Zychaea mexicana]
MELFDSFKDGRDPRMITTSIAAATALALYGVYYCTRAFAAQTRGKPINEIPAVDGAIPYFGHMFQIPKELPMLKFHEWHQRYGSIFRMNLGVKPWIVIGNRHIAHDILKINDDVTSGRPYHHYLSHYHMINRGGVSFRNPDERWRRYRAIAQTILRPQNVAAMTQTIEFEACRVSDLLLKGTTAAGVNTVKYMQLLTQNVITNALFGITMESLDDPLYKCVIGLVDKSIKWAGPLEDIYTFLPILAQIMDIFTSNQKKMAELIENKRNPVYRRLIQQALEHGRPCLVKDMYINNEQYEFDDDDILVFVSNMVNAGTETVAMALSWTVLILSRYKDVQKRLQQEVDAFIAQYNRMPVYEDRENLPLLISVQKECLRFRPPMHFALPRETTEDLEYKGYHIPKSTVLLANTFTMNFSEEYYDEPEKFIADRFLKDQRPFAVSASASPEKKRDQFVFGWGRRLCPGAHLADVEYFAMMVRILATINIEPPLDDKGEPVHGDLNAFRDAGLVVAPLESQLRFIQRPDKLI